MHFWWNRSEIHHQLTPTNKNSQGADFGQFDEFLECSELEAPRSANLGDYSKPKHSSILLEQKGSVKEKDKMKFLIDAYCIRSKNCSKTRDFKGKSNTCVQKDVKFSDKEDGKFSGD